MKLYFSPSSPFVRKCLVAAHELGIADRIELLACAAHPINRDRNIVARNPLGQVPTLLRTDGTALYDSGVICEYLNAQVGGTLIPSGDAYWLCRTEHALADGMLNATLLARYESALRPEALRWSAWLDGQMDKIRCGLAALDERCSGAGFDSRVDIPVIAFACALGYLDFRFPEFDWRHEHAAAADWYARFNARPSMRATVPRV